MGQPSRTLRIKGKVHNHDAVLLHNADQQHDTDDGNDTKILPEKPQCQQCADACRRQRGEDRERMEEVLIEHSQNDVDGDQRGQNQKCFITAHGKIRGSRALKVALHTCWHVQRLHLRVKSRNALTEGNARGKIERQRHDRKLALVRDGQWC